MTKIILIRHGQTVWNLMGRYQGHSDVELTEAGIDQAKRLAERLLQEKIAAIYSSDLNRAYQTARYVAFDRGMMVERMPAFREISFGDWEGLTYEEIKEQWPTELNQLFASADIVQIPNGERVVDVAERVEQGIRKLLGRHPNETIVIISHGMAIRCALAHFMHIPLRYVWNIRQDNTSVNKLSFYSKEHAIIDLVNDTHHLR